MVSSDSIPAAVNESWLAEMNVDRPVRHPSVSFLLSHSSLISRQSKPRKATA